MLMKPYFDTDELEEVKGVLDSGWVAQGPKVREFEERCENYLGVKHAIAVTNGTSALHLSMLGLDIGKGDEVIVADYTFPATGHAVMYVGAKPVFVDIDKKTYNIDPDKISDLITNNTKAVIPVHTFGQSSDMDAIIDICEDKGLKVVEDSACAFGTKYKGRFDGTIGDIGCYSFHARKGITTGEGGMVVTNNEELERKMRKLSIFGIENSWDRRNKFSIPTFDTLGYNYKMSDITASIGIAQMRKIDEIIFRRNYLADIWDNELKDIDGISTPFRANYSSHIFQSYVCTVDKKVRDELIVQLLECGIKALIGTYASHIQPIYNSKETCPNSYDIFKSAIALPMYYDMTPEGISYIADEIRNILEGH